MRPEVVGLGRTPSSANASAASSLTATVPYPSPAHWDWKILTGGVLGTIMFINVWALIWPNQKKVIAMTAAAAASGTAAPPEMARHARVAYLASRTNFWLSFPMLFFMIWAAHT